MSVQIATGYRESWRGGWRRKDPTARTIFAQSNRGTLQKSASQYGAQIFGLVGGALQPEGLLEKSRGGGLAGDDPRTVTTTHLHHTPFEFGRQRRRGRAANGGPDTGNEGSNSAPEAGKARLFAGRKRLRNRAQRVLQKAPPVQQRGRRPVSAGTGTVTGGAAYGECEGQSKDVCAGAARSVCFRVKNRRGMLQEHIEQRRALSRETFKKLLRNARET
ncbi:hypothetical protein B0H17DRAFT_1147617 [Mycena rosella]|uniref:Uncharacterized protein n=1 Tax=Mycena rosella TaxID=1033263 RepID=A0AAD7CM03_MYCRO|nr:hypothetical protein B0H17DRAFT_1147617 [Mycena rosella]